MAETDHHSHERAETPLNSYRNEGKGIHSIDTWKTRGWSLIICLIVYNTCTCTKTGHWNCLQWYENEAWFGDFDTRLCRKYED